MSKGLGIMAMIVCSATLAATGCGAAHSQTLWASPLDQQHPMVGRIWQVRPGRFVSQEALLDTLAGADLVLLGEKHDNADHHRLQAEVLRGLVQHGHKPALRMEMLTPDQELKLRASRKGPAQDADALGTAVDWPHSGWPDFAIYKPIFEVVLQANLDLGAANLPRALVRALATQGVGAVDAATAERLGLGLPVPEAIQAAMVEEIMASHCQQLPIEAAAPMALAQRARDAAMADALLQAPGGRAVLIAGNGHVRTDRGVPAHLRRRAPSAKVLVLSLVEVHKDQTDPAQALVDGDLAADFLWFTPRLDDEDPCAAFADQLRQLRERKTP